MKIKEILEKIESINELKSLLNIENGYVEFYIDNIQYGKEIHNVKEFKEMLENSFVAIMGNIIMDAEFELSCYANTMISTIEFKYNGTKFKNKLELFIDC